jgi:predicted regulator of Ras-like GTPase activity (Roadblock/LC7/MglB family)
MTTANRLAFPVAIVAQLVVEGTKEKVVLTKREEKVALLVVSPKTLLRKVV